MSNIFNHVINYVIDEEPSSGIDFLKLWREGSFDAIKKEFPTFDLDKYSNVKVSVEDSNIFNGVINYAIDEEYTEGVLFLSLWREGSFETIRKEFPNFKGYMG